MRNKESSYFGFNIGIIGILLIVLVLLFSSCGTYKMTKRQIQINYELDKAYLEYSYQRDSLTIEYYRIPVIEEDGIKWYTLDTITK